MGRKEQILSFLIIVLSAGIFLSFIVQAEKVILDIPSSLITNGKNITVIGIQGNAVNIDVDGVVELAEDNKTKTINGVNITVRSISRSPPRVVLEYVSLVVCGDNVCGPLEGTAVCCTDCGCLSSKFLCQNNRCVENITNIAANHECLVNSDCDDKNPCNQDVCDTSAFPNKCTHPELTLCLSGDTCCPKNCDTPEDQDCAAVDKCGADQECADENPCTTNYCSGEPKRCSSEAAVGCTLENQCVEDGTIAKGRYCVGSSQEWILQKDDAAVCAEDHECLSLKCIFKVCGGKKSVFSFKMFLGLLAVLIVAFIIYRKTKMNPPILLEREQIKE